MKFLKIFLPLMGALIIFLGAATLVPALRSALPGLVLGPRRLSLIFLLAGGALVGLGVWSEPLLAFLGRRLSSDNRAGEFLRQAFAPPSTAAIPAWNRLDWLCLALFLAFSLLTFLGRMQGDLPYAPLVGDAANTASFAAGMDHPELFKGDMVLGNPANTRIYSTFNVFFTRWVTPLTGSYSLSILLLVPLQMFFNLWGFYLLGRILLRSRGWSLLLVFLLACELPLNLGEYWFIGDDPVARFNFQAALPFVLCLVLLWRDRPRRWPWIMLATGFLVYLHPVSTPTWAVAIWLSLLVSAPASWAWWRRLGVLFLLGLVFLAAAAPYAFIYLSSHVQGKAADYDLIMTVINSYFPRNLIRVPEALAEYAPWVSRGGLLPLAGLGLLILLCLRSARRDLRILLAWVGGILLVAVCLPWGMHSIEQALHLVPVETELVRGIRYLVPFLLIFVVWALRELNLRFRPRWAALLAGAAVLLFAAGYAYVNPPRTQPALNALACLAQGTINCTAPDAYALALRALREQTPPGATIYATFGNSGSRSFATAVRFNALRPLVYSNKDRGMLVYSNGAELRRWFDANQEIRRIQAQYDDPNVILKRHITHARALGARYVLTDLDFQPQAADLAPGAVIYRQDGFAIIRLD